MKSPGLRVGELARRTGLTVRSLHHYDAIGLLRPSLRTESGHRLYTGRDVARLQQVLSLRQLGLSLEEIRDCLDGHAVAPLDVIRLHIERLREQIERQQRLCARLETLEAHVRAAEEVSADQLFRAIEEMVMIEQYYTTEQWDALKKRRMELGETRIEGSHGDWAALIAEVRAEQERGTDPTDPKVQALAARWMSLVREFTGGDPGIEASARRLWNDQGDALAAQHGEPYAMRDVSDYIGRAIAALDTHA